MLKRLKQSTLRLMKSAGVNAAAHSSRWRRRRLAILAYHGIARADEHLWDGSQFMDAAVFRGRMQALKDLGCTVLPLAEGVARLYAGDLPERAVVLTFDDGTSDFAHKAFPVLKEFGFPVTLYLTTFYTQYNRPVFDLMCSYLLWKGRENTLDLAALVGGDGRFDLRDAAARAAARARVVGYARDEKLKAEAKDALAAALAAKLGLDYEALVAQRLMMNLTAAEVHGLAQAGVDVQLHTHRHRTPLDRDLFLRELRDNRENILRMTGERADHFCYPSGVYDRAFLPWLKEAGVVSATTCDHGLAAPDSDPLLLPRILDVSSLSTIEFEGLVTGVSLFLPRRRTAR